MTFRDGYYKMITTNNKGEFSVELDRDEYRVFDDRKKDINSYNALIEKYGSKTENYDVIDAECLERVMDIGITFIQLDTVANDQPEYIFKYNIHKGCGYNDVPCAEFIGHYPE